VDVGDEDAQTLQGDDVLAIRRARRGLDEPGDGQWTITMDGGPNLARNLATLLRVNPGVFGGFGPGILRLADALEGATYSDATFPDSLLSPLAAALAGEPRSFDRNDRGNWLVTKRTDGQDGPAFEPPSYPHDCGLDLAAAHGFHIRPGGTVNVHTGVAVALPPGTFGWITGRSSTWSRLGLQVMAGIIDEGWRGELQVMVHRPVIYDEGDFAVHVKAGTRLAQLIILPNLLDGLRTWQVASGEELPPGERGELGFGSSGE